MARNQISSQKILIFYSLTFFVLGLFSIVSANLFFNNSNNLLSVFNFISFITGFSLNVNKVVWLQNHFAIILNNIGIFLTILSICNFIIYQISSRFFVENVQKLAITIVFSVFTIVFFFNSFVCDDAYITFRTVDNFINGFGLTWNTAERVQVYTHPLWMFTLSLFYFIFHQLTFISDVEKFLFISTFLSYSITLSLVVLLSYKLTLQKSYLVLSLFILVIIHSNAFIDYSSSGLENPLTQIIQ